MGVVEFVVSNPFELLGAVQIAVLLSASLLLLYPVVAYARNVAYTEGLVGIAVGFFLLTISNAFGILIDYDVVAPALESSAAVRSILNFGASVDATIGIYYFARQFIDTGGEAFGRTSTDSSGGFDDAGD